MSKGNNEDRDRKWILSLKQFRADCDSLIGSLTDLCHICATSKLLLVYCTVFKDVFNENRFKWKGINESRCNNWKLKSIMFKVKHHFPESSIGVWFPIRKGRAFTCWKTRTGLSLILAQNGSGTLNIKYRSYETFFIAKIGIKVCISHHILCLWCFLTVLEHLNLILTDFWFQSYPVLPLKTGRTIILIPIYQ